MSMFAWAMPGGTELLILCAIVFLLFGATALPKLATNIGKVLPSFKKGYAEAKNEVKKVEAEMQEVSDDLKNAIKE